MIRPAVLVAAAAAALIFAPTAAMAQAPAGVSVSVSHRAPAALPFTITASGAKANEVVTLTIIPDPRSIGIRSFTHRANERGVVNFEVALADDGIYELTTKSASGAVLSTETVTVSQHGSVLVAGTSASASTAAGATAPKAAGATAPKAAGATAGTAAGPIAGTGAGTAAPGQLAFTGWRGMGLAGGGGVLVLAGTALVLAGQRRAPAQP